MEPTTSMGARLASGAVVPLIRKLFHSDQPGADLVDRPVRIAALVSFGGERRALGPGELRRLAVRLVQLAVRAAPPRERPVTADEEPAVAEALADTLTALGRLSLDDVQAVRLGHREFARELRRRAPNAATGLSTDGEALHARLVDTAALHVLNHLTRRSTFVARTLLEQSRQLDALVHAVDLLVERNPGPLAEDTAFERQYARYVVRRHGEVTLHGLDLEGVGEWPLESAYLSLEAGSPGSERPAPPLRAERAFGGSRRVLLRGAAGSGKSTLVQWLAVTTAGQYVPDGTAAGRTPEPGPPAEPAPTGLPPTGLPPTGSPPTGLPPTELLGRVPFVLPLRTLARGRELPTPDGFLAAVRCPVAGSQPPGWAGRVLAAGRGLLLVDGLDEIPEDEREDTRRWLRDLLAAFPDNLWLLTSRPSTVREGWLERDGFVPLELDPMSPEDVAAFVHRWHTAAGAEPHLADSLLTAVRAQPELSRLATNPLMCGLLCALHRERRGVLPRDRRELYEAVLTTLWERRDQERAVPTGADPVLDRETQVELLQRLAYWLLRNNRSELSRADALRQVERGLRQLPRSPRQPGPAGSPGGTEVDPPAVLRRLLVRSGLLREPTPDTVVFAHRTFQDYLGARAAVAEGDFPLLVDHGRDAQWDDVIQMAVAHARPDEAARILLGLLDAPAGTGSAGTEPYGTGPVESGTVGTGTVGTGTVGTGSVGSGASGPGPVGTGRETSTVAGRETLLAAACLEHATGIDPAVRAEVAESVAALVPPDGRAQARALAEFGGPLVLGLLPGPAGLTDDQAEAVVITATRIATDAAFPLLSRYLDHPAPRVHRQLTWAWHRFDTDRYAREIIAHLPAEEDLYFSAFRPEHLAALATLGGRPRVQLRDAALLDHLLDQLLDNPLAGPHRDRLTHLWLLQEVPHHTDLGRLSALTHLAEIRLCSPDPEHLRATLPAGVRLVNLGGDATRGAEHA